MEKPMRIRRKRGSGGERGIRMSDINWWRVEMNRSRLTDPSWNIGRQAWQGREDGKGRRYCQVVKGQ